MPLTDADVDKAIQEITALQQAAAAEAEASDEAAEEMMLRQRQGFKEPKKRLKSPLICQKKMMRYADLGSDDGKARQRTQPPEKAATTASTWR